MERQIGKAVLINDDIRNDIKSIQMKSMDLIIFDPPFNNHPSEYYDLLEECVPILTAGGSLISVNYVQHNLEIWSYLTSKNLLNFAEQIPLKAGTAKPRINGLYNQQYTMMTFYNGSWAKERKFYANQHAKTGNGQLYAPEKQNPPVITDFWDDRQYYPGRKGLTKEGNVGVLHSGAMANWVVEGLLYCFARSGDNVYDLFGGAGTVPKFCNLYNINCRSVEIDKDNYELMISQISEISISKKLDFIQYADKLSTMAIEKQVKKNSQRILLGEQNGRKSKEK